MRFWILSCLCVALACGDDDVTPDASGPDAGGVDAPSVDAFGMDAQQPDAQGVDGATPDVLTPDGNTPDVNESDVPMVDAGPRMCPSPMLPATIDGVEPESMANHSPLEDSNGNLYRLVESTQAEGNNPVMMKSSDDGETWAEVDQANRPEDASDLEGCYQVQVGSTIYFSITRGRRVWWLSFNTSDADTNADSWTGEERSADGLGSMGGPQYSSLAQHADGTFWIFFGDERVDGRPQIAYNRRLGVDDYTDKVSVGEPSREYTGPRAVRGSDGVHVVYHNNTDNELLWRTLSDEGVLSEPQRIDTSGTSNVAFPHANPVVLSVGGEERLLVAFTTEDDRLKLVTITDGVIGEERDLSDDTVLQDADVVTNEGTVASLTLFGDTLITTWVDEDSGDVRRRDLGVDGSLSDITTFWDSGDDAALYVYCGVHQSGNCPRLACTYDVGPHADDTGDIRFLTEEL